MPDALFLRVPVGAEASILPVIAFVATETGV